MTRPEVYEVSQKLVISGDIVERYFYQKPYIKGFPRLRRLRPRVRASISRPQQMIRDDNVRRARQKIRRLINSNPDLNKFMTLTFDSSKVNVDVTDLSEANKLFNTFIKRLNRYFPDLKYIAVPEFQKKTNNVHYHLLTNIKPFISNDDLSNIFWQYGFAWLRNTYNVDNLGAYVCKYLSKEIFDPRYFRKKKFFYSYNLLKPIVLDRLKDVKEFLGFFFIDFLKPLFEFECLTDFLGKVYYKRYKLDNLKVDV